MNKKFLIPIMVEDDEGKVKLSNLNGIQEEKEVNAIINEFLNKIDFMVDYENFPITMGCEIKDLIIKLSMSSSDVMSLLTYLKDRLDELETFLSEKDVIKLTTAINKMLKELNKEKGKEIKKLANELTAKIVKFFHITLNEPYLVYYRPDSLNKAFIHVTDVVNFIKMVELTKLNASCEVIINDNNRKLKKEELETTLKLVNLLRVELLNFEEFNVDSLIKCLEELYNELSKDTLKEGESDLNQKILKRKKKSPKIGT